jgi:hypothetical protein
MRGPRPTTSSTSADLGSDDDATNEVAGRPRTRASSRGGGANWDEGSARHGTTSPCWEITVTTLYSPIFFCLVVLFKAILYQIAWQLCIIFVFFLVQGKHIAP